MNHDPYFSWPEVSNSDLGWLQNQLFPRNLPDPTKAYRDGNAFDAILTEPERVNYFKRSVDEDVFDKETFDKFLRMKEAFWNDEFCQSMMAGSETQTRMRKVRQMEFNGIPFELGVRCKWDIWKPPVNFGGDIKSTTATTQAQFEAACKHFDYPRQRAWYMDIAGSDRDFLIGVSKVNFKVFKIAITRGDDFYQEGFNQYINLAYRHSLLFGQYKRQA